MHKLVITNGTGGSGKDTFCKMVADSMYGSYVMKRYSYAELTRSILRNLGVDVSEKSDELRIAMAQINKSLELVSDIPYKDCCERIDEWIKLDTIDPYEDRDIYFNIIMLDVRDPSVIERFKQDYKDKVTVLTVLVDNGTVTEATKEDTNVFDYTYDYVISNTRDLSFLKRQAENFAGVVTRKPIKIKR